MRLATVTALLASALPSFGHAPADELTPRPIQTGTLEGLRWQARPLVILGDGAEVEAQLAALMNEVEALRERDVVILTEGPGAAPLRERAGDGFMVLLIGKDGGVKLTQNSLIDATEIVSMIDAMPMRQNEARD